MFAAYKSILIRKINEMKLTSQNSNIFSLSMPNSCTFFYREVVSKNFSRSTNVINKIDRQQYIPSVLENNGMQYDMKLTSASPIYIKQRTILLCSSIQQFREHENSIKYAEYSAVKNFTLEMYPYVITKRAYRKITHNLKKEKYLIC